MKRILLTLAAMFFIGGTVMAQDNQRRERRQFSREEMAKHQTERMAEQLGLGNDQKEALLKLNLERGAQMGHMGPRGERNDSVRMERPTEEQMKKMRERMEESRANYEAEVKKILTEEQFAKFQEMEKAMRARGGMRGGMRGMKNRGEGFRGNRSRNRD